jgi:uncharacterized damage-inducible protein DinB
MAARQIELLLTLLDQAFDRKSWHGTNLRGSLRGIDHAQASWRPAPERHNIWELALHAAYWKYIVRRRLLEERRGSFPHQGSDWFPRPDGRGENDWKADVALLVETHRGLRRAVAALRPSELDLKPGGSKVSNLALITGVAAHDLYHAGQIQLLKRLGARQA